jgi:membrane protein
MQGAMANRIKNTFGILKESFKEFSEDECTSLAAALSYYTVFSLPALLVIIIWIVGVIWGQEAATGQIQQQVSGMLGPEGGAEIETMIQSAGSRTAGGLMAKILGIGALIFGATGAFGQLQYSINKIWEVEPDPEQGGVKRMALKRVLSFGMVLAIAFLLMVSLVLSAAIAAFGSMLDNMLPGFFSEAVLQGLNLLISLAVFTLLIAAIYKVLPDAVVAWSNVWVGAFATALLFTIGKFLIGLYLGNSEIGSTYGAAGSIVLILVWVYYSSLIVFFGAEFTQVWAKHQGTRIEPDDDAVRVIEEKKHIRDGVPVDAPETVEMKERQRRHGERI